MTIYRRKGQGLFTGMFVIAFMFLMCLTSLSWAGQVVTNDVKEWAKEAIAKEESLGTTSMPRPNTVAILDFRNMSGWDDLNPLQKGIVIMLMTDLAKVKGVQMVERAKTKAIVDEMKLEDANLLEQGTQSRVGKILGAEHVIGGDILKSDLEGFQISSNMLNVQDENVYGQAMSEGELLEGLFKMEKDLLFQIIEELKIEITDAEKKELEKNLSENLNALLKYFQAVEYTDMGEYEKAMQMFHEAVAEDPSLEASASEFVEEIEGVMAEGYSEPEGGWGGTYSDEIPDDKEDPNDREVNEVYVMPWNYAHPAILEETTWYDAEQRYQNDQDFRDTVDRGDYAPGVFNRDGYWRNDSNTYEYTYFPGSGSQAVGLQAVGTRDGVATLFIDPETVENIMNSPLLAYAVQEEEDLLNEVSLLIHRKKAEFEGNFDLMGDIDSALASLDIQTRDDFFLQRADAQSGRVLKDRNGQWVRTQQYILRPDSDVVQILSVSKRQNVDRCDVLNLLVGFVNPIDIYEDLRGFPWNLWLQTGGSINGEFFTDDRYWAPEGSLSTRWVHTTSEAPFLDYMLVSPQTVWNGNTIDAMREMRTFQQEKSDFEEGGIVQMILSEELWIGPDDATSDKYTYTDDWRSADIYDPAADMNEYWVYPEGYDGDFNGPDDNNPWGFNYMRRTGLYNPDSPSGNVEPFMGVDFYVVGDGDREDNRGLSDVDYSQGSDDRTYAIRDIWDAFRVNEPSTGSGIYDTRQIGENNLEIVFRGENLNIDVIYTPMSRMLWKDGYYSDEL